MAEDSSTPPPFPEGAFETIAARPVDAAPLPFSGNAPPPPPMATKKRQRTGTIAENRIPSPLPHPTPPPPHAPSPAMGWGALAPPPAAPAPLAPFEDRQDRLTRAAQDGATAASLEAARGEHDSVSDSSKRPASPEVRPARDDVVLDLVWFDAAAASRLEHEPLLRTAGDALEDAWLDKNEASQPHERARRAHVDAMHRAPRRPLGELGERLAAASEARPAARPVVCVDAEVAMCFGASALLRRMVAIAELHASDKGLTEVVERCRRAAARSWLPDDVAAPFCRQLGQAFEASHRGAGPRELVTRAERSLVEDRSYRQQRLFGGRQLRLTLEQRGHRRVAYLPRAARHELPLAARFSARLLVELRLRQDEQEADLLALRVLALALKDDPRRVRGMR